MTSGEPSLDQEGDPFADLNYAERFGDRRRYKLRVADLTQGHKEDAVRKRLLLRRGDCHRKSGLADASRPGQGDQTNTRVLERGCHSGHLVGTTQDRGWSDGERTTRRLEKTPGVAR